MISRELVLELLRHKQNLSGGYTGDDIIEIAIILKVTPRGLRRRLNNWINTDNDFQQLLYLGKKKPSLTLFEFFKIEQGLESNPIQVKKGMYDDIQEERKIRKQDPLAKSTFC
jgi:predicted nuclease of restriction endonuclease-like RecB superfamily